MTVTYRLRCAGTLDHYVFSDEAHAKQWLNQDIVKTHHATMRLEQVEVGPFVRCSKCKGEGFTRSVRLIRKLSVADLLEGTNGV